MPLTATVSVLTAISLRHDLPPFYTDNLAHDLKVERFYDHVGSTWR